MNKHILSYSDKLNESIGRGSVLLIKGRPTSAGMMLYVTSIKGWAEIRPGLKMVFIGDIVYRVIHKGDGKFAGRKVDIKGEDGLKGVFNMKNVGKPSLVLNHNKTPFHWMTLKHTDIGTALRELGPRLFTHEVILESASKLSTNDANVYIAKELFKKLAGKESAVHIIDVISGDESGDFEPKNWTEYEESGSNEYEWASTFKVILDYDKAKEPYASHFLEKGCTSLVDLDLYDDMGWSTDNITVNVPLMSEYYMHIESDAGDYWTPPSSDVHYDDMNTYFNMSTLTELDNKKLEKEYADLKSEKKIIEDSDDQRRLEKLNTITNKIIRVRNKILNANDIFVDEEYAYVGKDVEFRKNVSIVNKLIDDASPDEAYEIIQKLSTTLDDSSYLKSQINRINRIDVLNQNGISAEDKEKWVNINPQYVESIEKSTVELLDEYDIISKKEEVTEADINRTIEIATWIDSHLPIKFTPLRNLSGVGKTDIYPIRVDLIKNTINTLRSNINSPDKFILKLERILADKKPIWNKYLSNPNSVRNMVNLRGEKISKIHDIDPNLKIFLNPEYKV